MRKLRIVKNKMEKINIIPIMDAVFIFIFYLLMSAQFIDIHEIGTDVAKIASVEKIKKDKPPLALTLKVYPEKIEVLTGVPGRVISEVTKNEEKFNEEKLQEILHGLKAKYPDEKTAIIIPMDKVKYKDLVGILDHVRHKKVDNKFQELFNVISFGEF